jgi:hypothetical protein
MSTVIRFRFLVMASGSIIHTRKHRADALDVPIGEQGYTESQEVMIEDNCGLEHA